MKTLQEMKDEKKIPFGRRNENTNLASELEEMKDEKKIPFGGRNENTNLASELEEKKDEKKIPFGGRNENTNLASELEGLTISSKEEKKNLFHDWTNEMEKENKHKNKVILETEDIEKIIDIINKESKKKPEATNNQDLNLHSKDGKGLCEEMQSINVENKRRLRRHKRMQVIKHNHLDLQSECKRSEACELKDLAVFSKEEKKKMFCKWTEKMEKENRQKNKVSLETQDYEKIIDLIGKEHKKGPEATGNL